MRNLTSCSHCNIYRILKNISNLQDHTIDGDFTDLQDLTDDSEQNEIIGTDLKQLIERELITGV